MDASGNIEDIGVPGNTIAIPTVGMSVAKSGRTTGFTTGTISSINTSVSVQYQAGCGKGKKFTVSFTGQSDPSSADTSAGFRYVFACDNGDLSAATYASSETGAGPT